MWKFVPILLAAAMLACMVPVYAAEGTQAHSQGTTSEAARRADGVQLFGLPSRHSPTLSELPRNIFRDQKFIWFRPFRAKRSDLPWAAAILTAGGLMPLDEHVGQKLSDSPPGAGFAFSRRVGQWGSGLTDLAFSGGFYLLGRWRNDEQARTTGLLGLQAVVDSMAVVGILKAATERPRPTRDQGRARNQNAEGEFFAGGSSFPSGHATQAWALAAVVAHRYRNRPWVPPVAYGLAGLVGVARVTQRRHFPTDVFVGSVLGYLIGSHVVHETQDTPLPKRGRRQFLPQVQLAGGMGLTLSWEF